MDNGQLRIYKAGLNGDLILRWVWNASRGAACCASIPKQQDKTPGNTINIFVILLIIIGLRETSLWGAAALRLYRRQASTMDTWKPLRIENSFSPDFMESICWTSHVSRGAACCASIPARQEKTAGNTINMFVILLIVIGMCGMSLRIDNSIGTDFINGKLTIDDWKFIQSGFHGIYLLDIPCE